MPPEIAEGDSFSGRDNIPPITGSLWPPVIGSVYFCILMTVIPGASGAMRLTW